MTGRPLARFAARRLAWAAGSAALASVIAFVVFWTIPNVEPEWALGGGEKGTNETRAAARVEYGLDESLPVQFFELMRGIFTGRLECYSACGNLRAEFVGRLPATVWLVLGALALAAALAISIALVCVRHHGRPLDRTLLGVAAALHSVPSLVLSILLWTLLCERVGVFPYDGYTPLTQDPAGWAWHLALPWMAVALPLAGAYVPVLRASLLEVRSADCVRTARAKGLSERAVARRHVRGNALATPVTILGLDASHAFGRVRPLRRDDLRRTGHRRADRGKPRGPRPSRGRRHDRLAGDRRRARQRRGRHRGRGARSTRRCLTAIPGLSPSGPASLRATVAANDQRARPVSSSMSVTAEQPTPPNLDACAPQGEGGDATRGVRGGGIGPPPHDPRGLRSRQVSGARLAVP